LYLYLTYDYIILYIFIVTFKCCNDDYVSFSLIKSRHKGRIHREKGEKKIANVQRWEAMVWHWQSSLRISTDEQHTPVSTSVRREVPRQSERERRASRGRWSEVGGEDRQTQIGLRVALAVGVGILQLSAV